MGLDLGPLAFLSGHTANRYDASADKIVCDGDLKDQTATAIEKIRVILEAAGYAAADVVCIVQYVPPGAFGALPEIEALLHQGAMGHAPRHVVPVTRLLRRDALIELEVFAARSRHRAPRRNAMRLMSGEHGITVFGEAEASHAQAPAQGSLAEQVARIGALLREAGADWPQVARCRLLVATAEAAVLDEAARDLARLVPQVPTIPAVGVAAFPPGWGKAQLCVELAAHQPDLAPGFDASPRGLVRRAGPFLVATGLRADSGESIAQQAERLYGEIVPRLLESAGIGMEGIVQTVEWLTQDALAHYRQTGPIRRNALREPFPVSSGLVCSALPGGSKLAVDLLAIERGNALEAGAA